MSLFDWIVKFLREYGISFLEGTGFTLLMSIIGTLVGFIIGLLIAIVRTVPVKKKTFSFFLYKIINVILSAYIEVVRGTPMMVQALVIYYSVFAPNHVSPLMSALIIISVNTGAYMAEIVRGGIISVDKGQFEGAHSIGMNHMQTMVHVILPQAIRNIMPSIGNEFVVNIKDSSVLSVISITELMYRSRIAGGAYAKYLPAYLICAAIYFILTFTVTRILRLVEKKMNGNENYTICGSQSDSMAEIHVKGDVNA